MQIRNDTSRNPKRFGFCSAKQFSRTCLPQREIRNVSEPTRLQREFRNNFRGQVEFSRVSGICQLPQRFRTAAGCSAKQFSRTVVIFSPGRSHAFGRAHGRWSVAALRRFFRCRRGGRTPVAKPFRAQQGKCRSSQSLGEEYPWLHVDESHHRRQEQQESRRGASSL